MNGQNASTDNNKEGKKAIGLSEYLHCSTTITQNLC